MEGSFEVDQIIDFSRALPEGCHVLGFTAQLEILDPEGVVTLVQVCSGDVSVWKAVGMTESGRAYYVSRMEPE